MQRPTNVTAPAVRAEGWRERLRERVVAALPIVRTVFLLWLATRVGYVLISYFASALHLYDFQPSGVILGWQRWDANWYVIVSRLGYVNPSTVNFFPLFPAALGGLAWLLGDGSGPVFPDPDKLRLLLGMLLSNLGLLVGLYALARLALVDVEPGDREAPARTVGLALAYPFAMAWTIAYAEGFFIALAGVALLSARRGYWYWAALAAFLAGLSRPVAVILILPLAWEYGRQHGWWRKPDGSFALDLPALARGVVVVGATPAAIAAYCGYVFLRFHSFLLPFQTQFLYWHHVSIPQWQTFRIAAGRIVHAHDPMLTLEVLLFAAYAVIMLLNIRRVPFAYVLYMAGLLYMTTAAPVPSQTDLLWGTSRYLAQALPIYLIVARWTRDRPALQLSLCGAGLLLQGALTIALFESKPVL